MLCRKIEQWRAAADVHPEIRPIRLQIFSSLPCCCVRFFCVCFLSLVATALFYVCVSLLRVLICLCLFFRFEFIVVWSNSRAYFDQDRGAEFLRHVSETSIDSEVLARYTVLGAAFALLKYVETTSSLTFPRASVRLRFIDSNAGEFLTIDRRTAMGLEILANARSGDQKNCLFGTIDRTKVYQTVSACLICHFYAPSPCISLSLSLTLFINAFRRLLPLYLSLSLSLTIDYLFPDPRRGSVLAATASAPERRRGHYQGAPRSRHIFREPRRRTERSGGPPQAGA